VVDDLVVDELVVIEELVVDELVVVDYLVVDELPLIVEEINVLIITVLNKHGTIVLTEKLNLFVQIYLHYLLISKY